jgi:hypothetical protein
MDPIVIPALTTGGIVAVVSIIVSLAVMYVPGLRTKFAALTSEAKQAIFLLLALVVGLAWFLLPLTGICTPAFGFVCSPINGASFVMALLGVLVGTGSVQGVYALLPQPGDVQAVKDAR